MNDERFLTEDGILLRYVGADERVVVPDGITAIGDRTFLGCETITHLVLPNSVKTIGERAFIGCSWLTEIVLPESVEYIGYAAFRGCDSLESIELPDRLRIIPTACFYQCLSLKSVKLPSSLQVISARAFSGCCDIVSLDFPNGLTEIEESAFEHCTRLQAAVLPDGLLYIGRHAFSGCHRLAEVDVPVSVKSIGSFAFYQTAFLENADSELVTVGDGILISCISENENITVPEGVKIIGERAFAYNEHVRRVILSDGAAEICNNAFERCKALENISLPESLRTIGDRAFEDCASLAGITLPDNITHIGSGVFGYTPVGSVFETLILNDKYLIAYLDDEKRPQIPDTVEVIAGGAFMNNTDIEEVALNNSVRFVCKEAFRWCRGLKKVHIGANVRYLGEYAFSGCEALHAYIECAQRAVGENTFEAGQLLTFTQGENSFTVMLQNDLSAESCEHALFAFAAEPCEQRFIQMRVPEYCLPASICYAVYGGVYEDYLRENITSAVCMAVDREDSELLQRVLGYGFLTEAQAAVCAEYAIEHKALEQQVMIMRCKQDSFGSTNDEKIDSRFDW